MALFPRWSNAVAKLSALALGGGLVSVPVLVLGTIDNPVNPGPSAAPVQPVPFEHTVHVGQARIDCRYCHKVAERSDAIQMPSTESCMGCHQQVLRNDPRLAPVWTSYTIDRPIHWRRVNLVPDYVYFNHSIHVNKGVGCESCHGRVDQMTRVSQPFPYTMGWCLRCHRDAGPNLRPLTQITSTGWNPPPGAEDALAHALLRRYNTPSVAKLTDCSTCHH